MGVEKRKAQRRQVHQAALMVDEGGSVIGPCTMLDVSASGARITLTTKIDPPPNFVIFLSRYDPTIKRHCTLARKKGEQLGISFFDPTKQSVPKS